MNFLKLKNTIKLYTNYNFLKSSVLSVQMGALPKNRVEFRQKFNVAIILSLAMSNDVCDEKMAFYIVFRQISVI